MSKLIELSRSEWYIFSKKEIMFKIMGEGSENFWIFFFQIFWEGSYLKFHIFFFEIWKISFICNFWLLEDGIYFFSIFFLIGFNERKRWWYLNTITWILFIDYARAYCNYNDSMMMEACLKYNCKLNAYSDKYIGFDWEVMSQLNAYRTFLPYLETYWGSHNHLEFMPFYTFKAIF